MTTTTPCRALCLLPQVTPEKRVGDLVKTAVRPFAIELRSAKEGGRPYPSPEASPVVIKAAAAEADAAPAPPAPAPSAPAPSATEETEAREKLQRKASDSSQASTSTAGEGGGGRAQRRRSSFRGLRKAAAATTGMRHLFSSKEPPASGSVLSSKNLAVLAEAEAEAKADARADARAEADKRAFEEDRLKKEEDKAKQAKERAEAAARAAEKPASFFNEERGAAPSPLTKEVMGLSPPNTANTKRSSAAAPAPDSERVVRAAAASTTGKPAAPAAADPAAARSSALLPELNDEAPLAFWHGVEVYMPAVAREQQLEDRAHHQAPDRSPAPLPELPHRLRRRSRLLRVDH